MALRPLSVERPNPRSGAYSGRFGSDFGARSARISYFWPVTPILFCNSDFRVEIRLILLNLTPESFLRCSTVKGS